ncbi:hypothetical protein GALMADRAFT_238478 [Galerina marginata CBS 339.88]|uniref:DNA polymerase delta catalytic subunit n=1 Tax=Galerina marginata (strain CBS 339.88) TaxID=685588 RepID=A0A067TV42_GALM3|nr:hypothetical protein GALMADRAFT_238478 [Galerina marginata CBS 339.88]
MAPEDTTKVTELPTNSSKRPLVPAASFADVLEDLSKHDKGEGANKGVKTWSRSPLPESIDDKRAITFQNIDIRESNHESGASEIHLFGVTKAGHSILARVGGFDHYFYYPAPSGFSEEDLGPLREYLNTSPILPHHLSKSKNPIITNIEIEEQSTTPNGPVRPFLKISLLNHGHIGAVKGILTGGYCEYRGLFTSLELTHEAKIPYILRFMIDHQCNAMSWFLIPTDKYEHIPKETKISHCQLEVSLEADDLMICDTVDDREKFAPLRILSFDIETGIPSTEGQFPSALHDPVIQIGNMVSTYGQPNPSIRAIFTLGTCSPIAGTQVLAFEKEKELLTEWRKFFMEVDPDIVIGYNITQFDVPYLLNRARTLGLADFAYLGRVKSSPQRLGAWRPNFWNCPGYDGRLLLDVYHHIREHYPGLPGEGAYKLNGVSSHFLGQKKEDISYKQIPILQNGNADTRRDLAIYCMKDTYLPLLLLAKLSCFEEEVKEAKEAHVPFNVIRVAKWMKAVAKRCLDAIDQQYILPDTPH